MKKIYLSLSLIMLSLTCLSQKEVKDQEPKHKYADFAYATPQRDTLYLSAEDSLTRNIYLSWHMDPRWNGTNPTIVFMSQDFIDRRKSIDGLESDISSRNRRSKRGKK